MKQIDEVGNVYGRWTVKMFSHWHKEPSGNKVPYWLCRCECGIERSVNINNLKKGKSVSCGCYNREVVSSREPACKKAKGESSKRQLWLAYRNGAKKRGLEFELSLERFGELTSMDCQYCGIEPCQVNRIKGLNGDYIYNGIDRVDSRIGYLDGNCVPCCKRCNYAKRDSSYDELILWAKRLIEHHLCNCSCKIPLKTVEP